jgi:hypothetical protein
MASFLTRQKPAIGLRWCPQGAGKKWQRNGLFAKFEVRIRVRYKGLRAGY